LFVIDQNTGLITIAPVNVKQQAAPVPNLGDSYIPIFGALLVDGFCCDYACQQTAYDGAYS
jgi:hypothetical protein